MWNGFQKVKPILYISLGLQRKESILFFLLWKKFNKAMTNLDSMLKSRDIISLTKVHKAKAMV